MSGVDVVIPCYNYGCYLSDCVQSVLRQQGVDLRILIIDDCSTDNTQEVAAALAADDSRVFVRRHTINRGHIATYNEGLLEWASGDYCVLLSADDQLTHGSLGRTVTFLDAHPEMVMAYGHGIWTSEPGNEPPQDNTSGNRVISGQDFIAKSCNEGGNPVTTPTAVVRTAVQQRLGGYRVELPHSGDMEMWLRFAAHGSIGFIDANQAFYRTHGHNMYRGFTGARDLEQRWAAFEVLFREYGHLLSDHDGLRALARRRMAQEAFWLGSRLFERGDIAEVRTCHKLAFKWDPGIRRSTSWWKFKLKRLVGPRAWRRITPLLASRHK